MTAVRRSGKERDLSPLEKWRRLKNKVLERASVEAKPLPGTPDLEDSEKTRYAISETPKKLGDLDYVPIIAPKPKGEATMIPGQAQGGKGEATMVPGQAQGAKGEATMVPGQAQNAKGEATMVPGQTQGAKGEATMIPGQAQGAKGEATMIPGQPQGGKGEAEMISGRSSWRRKSEPKMIPGESLKRRGGGPTLIAGQAKVKTGPTMIAGRAKTKAGPTMIAGRAKTKAGPTLIAGRAKTKAGPTMMAGRARAKAGPTMLRTTRKRPKLDAAHRALAEKTVKTFLDELRAIAERQGMEFFIEQPDTLTVDFFTETKALRVAFTGREIDLERIVVRDALSIGKTETAREKMLNRGEAEKGLIRTAPVPKGISRDFDWDDGHAPDDAEKLAPDAQIAIEAHFFDAEENRDWMIELVNRAQEEVSAEAAKLTAVSARRLVMLLLDSLDVVTGTE